MLVEKRKEGDVVSIKLVSGEEIFGRFVHEGPNVITLAKVMKLVIDPQTGRPGFTSVMQTATEKDRVFDKNHCVIIGDTLEEIQVDYLGQTSSIKKATPTEESAIIRP